MHRYSLTQTLGRANDEMLTRFPMTDLEHEPISKQYMAHIHSFGLHWGGKYVPWCLWCDADQVQMSVEYSGLLLPCATL